MRKQRQATGKALLGAVAFIAGLTLSVRAGFGQIKPPSIGSAPVGPGADVSGPTDPGWVSTSGGPIATTDAVAQDSTWVAQTLGNVIQQVGAAIYQGEANIAQTLLQMQQFQQSGNQAVQQAALSSRTTYQNAQTYYAPLTTSASCQGADGAVAFAGAPAAMQQVKAAVSGSLGSVGGAPVAPRAASEPLVAALSADPVAAAAAKYNMGMSTKDGASAAASINADYKSAPAGFDAASLANPEDVSAGDPAGALERAVHFIYHATDPMPPANFTARPSTVEGQKYDAQLRIRTAKMSLAQDAMRHVADLAVPNPAFASWAQQVISQVCSNDSLSGPECTSGFPNGASLNDVYALMAEDLRFRNINWYTQLYSEPEPQVMREIAEQLALANELNYRRLLIEERRLAVSAANYAQTVDNAYGSIEEGGANAEGTLPPSRRSAR